MKSVKCGWTTSGAMMETPGLFPSPTCSRERSAIAWQSQRANSTCRGVPDNIRNLVPKCVSLEDSRPNPMEAEPCGTSTSAVVLRRVGVASPMHISDVVVLHARISSAPRQKGGSHDSQIRGLVILFAVCVCCLFLSLLFRHRCLYRRLLHRLCLCMLCPGRSAIARLSWRLGRLRLGVCPPTSPSMARFAI